MPPFFMPPVFLIFLVFSFVLLLVKMGMDHKTRIKELSTPENSLKVGELKALIREAVEEANAPLERRIDRLEERLERQDIRPLAAAQPRVFSERAPHPAGEDRPD